MENGLSAQVRATVYVRNADSTPYADFKIDAQVTSLLLLDDGKWVVGTSQGNIYVRNADGIPYTDFKINAWVGHLLLLPDGNFIASTNSSSIYLIDPLFESPFRQ